MAKVVCTSFWLVLLVAYHCRAAEGEVKGLTEEDINTPGVFGYEASYRKVQVKRQLLANVSLFAQRYAWLLRRLEGKGEATDAQHRWGNQEGRKYGENLQKKVKRNLDGYKNSLDQLVDRFNMAYGNLKRRTYSEDTTGMPVKDKALLRVLPWYKNVTGKCDVVASTGRSGEVDDDLGPCGLLYGKCVIDVEYEFAVAVRPRTRKVRKCVARATVAGVIVLTFEGNSDEIDNSSAIQCGIKVTKTVWYFGFEEVKEAERQCKEIYDKLGEANKYLEEVEVKTHIGTMKSSGKDEERGIRLEWFGAFALSALIFYVIVTKCWRRSARDMKQHVYDDKREKAVKSRQFRGCTAF